jgi:hypothetical protein
MMLILFLLDYQTDVIKILDVLRNPALVYVLPSLYLDFFLRAYVSIYPRDLYKGNKNLPHLSSERM